MAERAGRRCGRAAASVEAASVPLAAIGHLLPADLGSRAGRGGGAVDAVELFARTKGAFEDLDGNDRFVLMVDDLHLLDVASATLLRQLLVTGTIFLVATVLADRRVPLSVTTLWRDDRCLRVDLDQLSRDSVETLLHHALGHPSTVRRATLCGRQAAGMCCSSESWYLARSSRGRWSTTAVSGGWRGR